jgi:hypothetical protein
MLMLKTGTEKPVPPTPELMAALGKLTEELVQSGRLVETGGMQAASSGTTLHLSSGKVTVTDGPFTEANEVVGGYAIIDVDSKEEVIALGRRFLEVHAEILGPSYVGESEIRRIYTHLEPGRKGGSK